MFQWIQTLLLKPFDLRIHIKAEAVEQPVTPEHCYWMTETGNPPEQGNSEHQIRDSASKKVEGEDGHSGLSSDSHMSHGMGVPTVTHANAHPIIYTYTQINKCKKV